MSPLRQAHSPQAPSPPAALASTATTDQWTLHGAVARSYQVNSDCRLEPSSQQLCDKMAGRPRQRSCGLTSSATAPSAAPAQSCSSATDARLLPLSCVAGGLLPPPSPAGSDGAMVASSCRAPRGACGVELAGGNPSMLARGLSAVISCSTCHHASSMPN